MKASGAFRTALLPVVAGAAILALVDAAIGLRGEGLVVRGGREHALYFLHGLAWTLAPCLVAGIAFALACAVPAAATFGRRRLPAVAVVLALAAGVAVVVANLDLFEGPGVRTWRWRAAAAWAFRLVAGPAVAGAVLAAAAGLAGSRPRRAAGLLLLAGFALLFANRLFRNQYAGIHLQLAIAAVGALAAGAGGLLRGTRLDPASTAARAGAIVGAAVAVVLASAHAGRVTSLAGPSARAEAAVVARADAVSRLEPWARRLLALVGRPAARRASTPDVGGILARIAPQVAGIPRGTDVAARRAELDRLAPGRRSFSILWIAIDTLRADHAGHLGYARRTTPNLDALAAESFVFERAYTPYPTSSFGFSSALTSLAARAGPVLGRVRTPPAVHHPAQALPALLRDAGRETVAITAFDRDDVDDPRAFRELREGFTVFNPNQTESAAHADQITTSARSALRDRLADPAKPFFLWVHYLEPHDPYVAHAEFDFGSSAIDRYDSEIAVADRHAGSVLDALRASGRLESTIVVAFSDHGEEFGEHGGRFHNGSVYDEQARVPLVVRIPGMTGRRIRCPVSLLDLVPTLVELLDLSDQAPRHGRSLAPVLLDPRAESMAYSEVFATRGDEIVRSARAVVVGSKKLIRRVPEERLEMFDLDQDRGETTSLVGRGDPDEGMLRGVMEAWDRMIDGGAVGGRSLDAAIQDALARLEREPEEGARAAAAELEAALVTPYGAIRADAARALGDAGIVALLDRLATIEPLLAGTVPTHVVGILAARRDRRYAPTLRRTVSDPATRNETRLRAALALAQLDDAAGLAILREAAAHPRYLDKTDLGWSLLRLGDAACVDWYDAVLRGMRFGAPLMRSVEALPAFGAALAKEPAFADVPPARAIRDRVFHESGRDPEVDLAIVDALRGRRDEESVLVLLRLMRAGDESVRAAAAAALATVMPAPDVAKNLAAMDEAIDADSAQVNAQHDAAAAGYRHALRIGTLANVGLRFRLAAALHEGGRAEEARLVLAEIERTAPIAHDRALARRRIDQLRWPGRPDPARLRCTVVACHAPEAPPAGMVFGAALTLRNDGPEPWAGGWGPGGVELHLRFEDESGAVVDRPAEALFANRLKEEGVDPGEQVGVLLLGVGPAGPRPGRLALSFRSRRTQYPDGGIVWRRTGPGDPSSR